MFGNFYWWQGGVGGLGGVVAMTMVMRMGQSKGMTSMDMPLILGSMLRRDERSAKAIGTIMHLVNGAIFGLIYAFIWVSLGITVFSAARGWWVGAIFGLIQGLIAAMAMPMMSAMHPRAHKASVFAGADGRSDAGVRSDVALPAFGIGGTGFGKRTPAALLMAHLVFGVVWGIVFTLVA